MMAMRANCLKRCFAAGEAETIPDFLRTVEDMIVIQSLGGNVREVTLER